MRSKRATPLTRAQQCSRLSTSVVLVMITLLALSGCGPSPRDLAAVDYAPLPGGDWEVSSPEAEGLDPDMVAKLYYDAAKLDSIYSLLIVKNGYLVAEKYFNDGSIDLKSNIQSMTKSYISALVGLALEQGCLTTLDQPFLDFFPEYADQIEDPRRKSPSAISCRCVLAIPGKNPTGLSGKACLPWITAL